MRNNFVPSFHKKQPENNGKPAPTFFMKNTQVISENPTRHTAKKLSFHLDSPPNQYDFSIPGKQISQAEEESLNSDQKSSCKSSQRTIKPCKLEHNLVNQQRLASPSRYHNTSPLQVRPSVSPITRQSKIGSNHFIPIRATLKNLLQIKLPHPENRNQQNLGSSKNCRKQAQFNSSYRANKTVTEVSPFSPSKNMEKQYQMLREENETLKHELNEIKKKMVSNPANKKEDLICNLRDTIKKEDNEIKELRVKLDIYSKKNALLTTLIENKDEEITYLNNKLAEVEQQFLQLKQRKAEKFQKLKERINYMLKSYTDLQLKWNNAEMDWLDFKESWMQEKDTYIQRISFLETYIAEN